MKGYRIGVLAGDGIGPEIVEAVLFVLRATIDRLGGPTVEWVELPVGLAAFERHGAALPESTIAELERCDGWILGPHDSAAYPEAARAVRNPSGELRHRFDLYANIRPSRSLPGVPALLSDVDLVIVRENTEGFYPDRNMVAGVGEFMPTPDVALSVGVFTRRAAERIAHAAFRLAMDRRRYVSIVHKANVVTLGTGLFRDVCRAVGAGYPEVRVDDYHVDAMAAHLVRRARDFDVIVTTNMFGDILSDLAAELVGSLGLAGAINAGERYAMAQAAHGSAPDIAGRGIANPVGLMLSAVLLFRWLGERHKDPRTVLVGNLVEQAIDAALAAGVRTADLGGVAGTRDFAMAVVRELRASDMPDPPAGA